MPRGSHRFFFKKIASQEVLADFFEKKLKISSVDIIISNIRINIYIYITLRMAAFVRNVNSKFADFIPNFIKNSRLYQRVPTIISHPALAIYSGVIGAGTIGGSLIGCEMGYEMGSSIIKKNKAIGYVTTGMTVSSYGTIGASVGFCMAASSPVTGPLGFLIDKCYQYGKD